jgi:hypothetical protein
LLWNDKYNEQGELIGENFIKQLALGTGVGIRADFSYFVIRFDLGIKVRNSYPDDNYNFWALKDLKKFSFRDDVNPNLAIGFPF